MSVVFDQSGWVKKHGLKGKSVETVFAYVKMIHPFMGMAFPLEEMTEPGLFERVLKMDLREMAEYADAVTVACTDDVYQDPSVILSDFKRGVNVTSLGNVAYVALHHSEPAKRQKYVEMIKLLRPRLETLSIAK